MVSPATVSRLINGSAQVSRETERAVRQAMQELGYVPSRLAQSFARGSSRTVLFLVDGESESMQNNSFLMTIVLGLNDVLADADYSIRIMSGHQTVEGIRKNAMQWSTEAWRRREFDGIVLSNPTTNDPLIEAVIERKIPAVVIGRYSRVAGVVQVDVDNVGGTRLATQSLTALGHRRIAFLGPPEVLTVTSDRRQGYLEALARMGIKPLNAWILETDGVDLEVFSFEAARRTVEKALTTPLDWTALVAFNDEMALGAMRALSEAGLKVPEDVSVVGFDDLPYARMVTPSLSTVHQDIQQLGQHAGRALLALLRGQATADLTIQTVSLVNRETTATPPTSAETVDFSS